MASSSASWVARSPARVRPGQDERPLSSLGRWGEMGFLRRLFGGSEQPTGLRVEVTTRLGEDMTQGTACATSPWARPRSPVRSTGTTIGTMPTGPTASGWRIRGQAECSWVAIPNPSMRQERVPCPWSASRIMPTRSALNSRPARTSSWYPSRPTPPTLERSRSGAPTAATSQATSLTMTWIACGRLCRRRGWGSSCGRAIGRGHAHARP
jgi:hypothetical protein